MVIKIENYRLMNILNKIKTYLRYIIIDFQNSDAWKIKLTIAINSVSSKDSEEEHVMNSNSRNIKFTPYSDPNDVTYECLKKGGLE